MKKIIKLNTERTFEACHYIPNHKGACKNMHGHSYKVLISIAGILENEGILVDFHDIKDVVDRFDHSTLNHVFKFPSAENLARFFALKILRLKDTLLEVTVTVYETENCCATATVGRE